LFYYGDRLTRDAAYHQGTAWSWLIGPYLDALVRVRPDDVADARRTLDGLVAHLGANCVGYIGEVFDAEAPYTPGGCVAQAWGVAELLRAMLLVDRAGAGGTSDASVVKQETNPWKNKPTPGNPR